MCPSVTPAKSASRPTVARKARVTRPIAAMKSSIGSAGPFGRLARARRTPPPLAGRGWGEGEPGKRPDHSGRPLIDTPQAGSQARQQLVADRAAIAGQILDRPMGADQI